MISDVTSIAHICHIFRTSNINFFA